MTIDIVIRPETPDDRDAVRAINLAAFGQPDEAKLVDVLRNSIEPSISLVAEHQGRVVGHILFTPVTIQTDAGEWTAMGLAPMAVDPACQKQGAGAALIQAGLDLCLRIGHPIVFVLGHPEYYPRFGFRPAPPLGLRCEYPIPDEVFMVVELEPNVIAGRTGLVKYNPAFNELG